MCRATYPLVIWCRCITESPQLGLSSKTDEVSTPVKDSQNYLFWGRIYEYKIMDVQDGKQGKST